MVSIQIIPNARLKKRPEGTMLNSSSRRKKTENTLGNQEQMIPAAESRHISRSQCNEKTDVAIGQATIHVSAALISR